MKKIYLYSIIALTGLSACSESFLDVYPPSGVMASDYYQTEADITQALVAAYDPLQWDSYVWGQYNQITMISDMMSDDVKSGGGTEYDQKVVTLLNRFQITPLEQPDVLWTIYYSGVNRALQVIENIDKIQGMSPAAKNRVLGEAKYLFTYYYHWLWKLWGNIPYYDKNLTTPFTAPQLTADEVYAKLVAVMDEVIGGDYLPLSVADGEQGRITRAAAQMLKARMVMYQQDRSRYAEVLADMEDIESKGYYSLKSDFEGIFKDEGEWSSESIFEVNYYDKGASRTWDYSNGVGGTVFPKLIGPRGLKNSPDFQEGWGFDVVMPTLYGLYDPTDQRRDGGILNMQKYMADNPGCTYDPSYDDTGFFNKKYAPRKGYNDVTTGNADMNFRNNIRIFRYAEVLLNMSELRLRLGSGDAQTPFDAVRRRAFGTSFTQRAVTLDGILSERHLEFACEGHRYWDLQRFNKAEEVLGAKGYVSYKKYWPLPAAEIDRTHGELKQNPGYN